MLLLVLGVFLMLSLSLGIAVDTNKTKAGNGTKAPAKKAVDDKKPNVPKNMTYGQCVVKAAETKNTCYDNMGKRSDTCNKGNKTDNCKENYSAGMDACKAGFKNKKDDCKQIKHNFFQTIWYALK